MIASFEGGWINLTDGWGEATACTSDGFTAECYRTEAEMDAASHNALGSTAARSVGIVPLLACASSLKLYRSTSFTGAVLQLTSRGAYINLSTYGFDNDTSSYKVGACTSYFYDGASGGTPLYPGTTTANSSANSMLTGWDNRVSSVYIT
ncbi:MAG: hypothetical protein HY828_08130 [Actinobacteria bacterium]|nr:hypothetical protein [Actinomycetota bacterium]